jgi:hypothetical protein
MLKIPKNAAPIVDSASATHKISQHLQRQSPEHSHIWLIGQHGTGKTATLRAVESQLRNQFVCIHISIRNQLDPNRIHFVGLIIVVVSQLLQFCAAQELNISQKTWKSIRQWLQHPAVADMIRRFTSIDPVASIASFEVTEAALSEMAKSIHYSPSCEAVLRDEVEPSIALLMEALCLLCGDTNSALKYSAGKLPLLLIDDLDKIDLQLLATDFFPFLDTFCRLPIAWVCAVSRAATILPDFRDRLALHTTRTVGLTLLDHDSLENCLNWEAYSSVEVANELIQKSSGCIGDLLWMQKEAQELCEINGIDKIEQAQSRYAQRQLQRMYEACLSDWRSTEDTLIPCKTFREEMRLVQDDRLASPRDPLARQLLVQYNCLLEQPDGGWMVHPLLASSKML